jgi:Sec-independent protein translocase protein TatA
MGFFPCAGKWNELSHSEIILIALILIMIFGVGWISGSAGWARKGVCTIRKGLGDDGIQPLSSHRSRGESAAAIR